MMIPPNETSTWDVDLIERCTAVRAERCSLIYDTPIVRVDEATITSNRSTTKIWQLESRMTSTVIKSSINDDEWANLFASQTIESENRRITTRITQARFDNPTIVHLVNLTAGEMLDVITNEHPVARSHLMSALTTYGHDTVLPNDVLLTILAHTN